MAYKYMNPGTWKLMNPVCPYCNVSPFNLYKDYYVKEANKEIFIDGLEEDGRPYMATTNFDTFLYHWFPKSIANTDHGIMYAKFKVKFINANNFFTFGIAGKRNNSTDHYPYRYIEFYNNRFNKNRKESASSSSWKWEEFTNVYKYENTPNDDYIDFYFEFRPYNATNGKTQYFTLIVNNKLIIDHVSVTDNNDVSYNCITGIFFQFRTQRISDIIVSFDEPLDLNESCSFLDISEKYYDNGIDYDSSTGIYTINDYNKKIWQIPDVETTKSKNIIGNLEITAITNSVDFNLFDASIPRIYEKNSVLDSDNTVITSTNTGNLNLISNRDMNSRVNLSDISSDTIKIDDLSRFKFTTEVIDNTTSG